MQFGTDNWCTQEALQYHLLSFQGQKATSRRVPVSVQKSWSGNANVAASSFPSSRYWSCKASYTWRSKSAFVGGRPRSITRERFLWHMYTLMTQKYVLIHVIASGAVSFALFFFVVYSASAFLMTSRLYSLSSLYWCHDHHLLYECFLLPSSKTTDGKGCSGFIFVI